MMNFDEYRDKGIKFYKKVARELQLPQDLVYADRLVSSLLNVLRERLTFKESLELLSVFPIHVKGLYVHGWRIHNDPKRLSSEDEFLNALRLKFPHSAGRRPGNNESLRKDIGRLLTVIKQEALARGVTAIEKLLPEVLHPFCREEDTPRPVVEVISEGSKHFPEVQPIKNEV